MAESGRARETRDVLITRVFDAPRRLVWDVWTKPEHFKRWWGPKEYSSPAYTVDLRPGGRFVAAMRGPDGKDLWSRGVFREVVPYERIVYDDAFSDEKGNLCPASEYGMDEPWPDETRVTVTFEDVAGGKTKLTLRHEGMPKRGSEMAEAGWNESLDKFAAALARAKSR